MLKQVLAAVILTALAVNAQGVCKEPQVEERLLADDVRYASPFYVIALPKNPRTEQMDNVCYTYYETTEGGFFHVMSITYKNGSNEFFTYTKSDITNRMGLAEAKAERDQCVYHDYTLTPICKMSVFILYRCFIQGNCGGIDIGPTAGVDVRVTLAAQPNVSGECRQELERSLKDTSKLAGANYVILPQKLAPQCVTRYNNSDSIGNTRAVGSKLVTENELIERFGSISERLGDFGPTPAEVPQPQGAVNQGKPAITPANSLGNRQGNPYGRPPATGSQGYTPAPMWPQNNGQWNAGPSPWGPQNNGEQHFHMWQQQPNGQKTTTPQRKNSNVFYHIHSWENPPPGCCKCNN